MIKRLLFIFLALLILPANAGDLESALSKDKPVFLYLYTPDCGYCNKFAPKYDELNKKYNSEYTFLKIDASTYYGHSLMRQFRTSYVPFVVIMKPKTKKGSQISNGCIMITACMDKVLKDFKK